MTRTTLLASLLAASAALPSTAHAAELRVRVSRALTERYGSVGITVIDPRHGLDAHPGPLTLTMADGADRRQELFLEPTGQPGEWYGRFTPLSTGRYTGTVVLERNGSQDIGLVPLVRVKPSRRPGILRLHPSSGRLLKWSSGGGFFPIGVRLAPEDLRAVIDWRVELARLRNRGVNYLEVPVAWPGDLPANEQLAEQRRVDALLLLAERIGWLGVQLDLLPPADAQANAAAYEEQLGRWVRRWSYSPAVAVWNVAGATGGGDSETNTRWVKAVRAADRYRHPVAVPGDGSQTQAPAGADLQVIPANWQRPVHRFAILEAPETAPDASPLPGESSWQMLAIGGIGLPLLPYHPGAGGPAIARLTRLAAIARTIPFQYPGQPLTGITSVDTPGTFCQYGNVVSGWVAPEGEHTLTLHTLPRSRYRVRYFDPGNDVPRGSTVTWSDGRECTVRLPAEAKAVYLQIEPVQGGAPIVNPAPQSGPRTVIMPRPNVRPAPTPSRQVRVARRSQPVVHPSRRGRPVRLTRAQRLAQLHAEHVAALHAKHLAALEAKRGRGSKHAAALKAKAKAKGRGGRALSAREKKQAALHAKHLAALKAKSKKAAKGRKAAAKPKKKPAGKSKRVVRRTRRH